MGSLQVLPAHVLPQNEKFSSVLCPRARLSLVMCSQQANAWAELALLPGQKMQTGFSHALHCIFYACFILPERQQGLMLGK